MAAISTLHIGHQASSRGDGPGIEHQDVRRPSSPTGDAPGDIAAMASGIGSVSRRLRRRTASALRSGRATGGGQQSCGRFRQPWAIWQWWWYCRALQPDNDQAGGEVEVGRIFADEIRQGIVDDRTTIGPGGTSG